MVDVMKAKPLTARDSAEFLADSLSMRWCQAEGTYKCVGVREALVHDVEEFLAETRISDRAFGLRAANNSKLMQRLRSGCNHSIATLEKISATMRDVRIERAEATVEAE